MTKSFKDYLPIKSKDEKKLVQVRVRKDLVNQAQIKMNAHGIKWSEFFEACLRRFLDEEL